VERYGSDGKRAVGLHFDRSYESTDPKINQECEVPWYPTTCLLVRRSSWEAVSGFDEQFEIAEEDKDCSLALRSAGFRLTYNPLSRVIHHGYPRDPEYAKIRANLLLLHRDRTRLEDKWSCDVINETSRRFLAESGFSQEQIARYARLSVFMKITN
jgi:GT2 family glycosyltransferase